MNLNSPTIHAGPLTAADLDAARKHSTGNVYLLPAGLDQQGRHQTRSRSPWHDTVPTDFGAACAIEGGEHREPSRTLRPSPLLGVLLVLSGWPLVLAVVALVVFLAQSLPRIP